MTDREREVERQIERMRLGSVDFVGEQELRVRLAESLGSGSPTAREARHGSVGARSPSRAHRRAREAARFPGARAHADLPDRRFHCAHWRSVGQEEDAPRARRRRRAGERADVRRAGESRARRRARRDPLQQRMDRAPALRPISCAFALATPWRACSSATILRSATASRRRSRSTSCSTRSCRLTTRLPWRPT